MGTQVVLPTYVPGTTMSSGSVNSSFNSINTASTYFFNTGSMTGITTVSGTTAVPTNFTNPLGALPAYGGGNSDTGAFHLVCWNGNASSASILVLDPDQFTGGTHWSALFIEF